MKKTVGDYIVLLISILGSFASILGFGVYFTETLNSQGWLGVLFLGVLTFFFLFYNFYLISKYRKKSRYPEVFEDLNLGFSSFHRMDRNKLEKQTSGEITNGLTKLCDAISDAFTKINGHSISCCIKFLILEKDRPRVVTLIRDNKSTTKGRKTGSMDETKHWLDQNSDFNFIYSHFDDDNTDTSFFYKTRLPIRKDYLNTRLKKWPPKKIPWIENIIRRKNWPLRYKSTLVVPIVPLLANEQKQSGLRGFLCLDSPNEVAFNTQIDVEILKGISDGIYNKMKFLN